MKVIAIRESKYRRIRNHLDSFLMMNCAPKPAAWY